MIEDFFRLSSDAIRYYPKKCISSSLAVPIFSAALSALTLQQVDPLIATLHYYRDLFSFAFEKPMVSGFTSPEGEPYSNPSEVREAVKGLLVSQGQLLAQRVLTGMMFTFPGDCFPDASGVMMTLFELLPHETGAWLQSTLQMLPPGSIKPGEAERLLKNISDKVHSGETRKIRVLLQGKRRRLPRQGSYLTYQTSPTPTAAATLHHAMAWAVSRRPGSDLADEIFSHRCTFLFSFLTRGFSGVPPGNRNENHPRSICTSGVGSIITS